MNGVAVLKPSHDQIVREREEEALLNAYRHARGNYASICRILVQRGLLAEMPPDLDKPLKV